MPAVFDRSFDLLESLLDASSNTMHARLCSDLAWDYNSQSSCVLVGQMGPLCGTTPYHALLCNHDLFLQAIVNELFYGQLRTNLVVATCHALVNP